MASGARERKKANNKKSTPAQDTKTTTAEAEASEEPTLYVAVFIMLAFSLTFGLFVYYKMDERSNGSFAAFINQQIANLKPKNRYQKG